MTLYEVSESDAQVELCAVLTGMLQANIPPIMVTLVGDSAQEGNIYLISRMLCNTYFSYTIIIL